MNRVLLITGPAGDAQGWGDLAVTRTLCDALQADDLSADIAFVESMDEFSRTIDRGSFDMVWSALYHISDKADIIGTNADDNAWLADILDRKQIPYVGPSALTMRQLINKAWTHGLLREKGISVPEFAEVAEGATPPAVSFPAFVKPACESRSVGIDDGSVVHTRKELKDRVRLIHERFLQPALVETYLPGAEYTVLMLGNGDDQEFLSGIVTVKGGNDGRYPILRSDLRGVGRTLIAIPDSGGDEAVSLCREAVSALACKDHVRVDMRRDDDGRFRIIEVNGIPGLKPVKSWSPQIYTLYHGSANDPMEDYRRLVRRIVDSAFARYGLR